MSLLGIDVGTSGCKAALFSEDGRMLELAYEEYDYQCPQPGWAELDSLKIWEPGQTHDWTGGCRGEGRSRQGVCVFRRWEKASFR